MGRPWPLHKAIEGWHRRACTCPPARFPPQKGCIFAAISRDGCVVCCSIGTNVWSAQMYRFKEFLRDETGAVTVDWVVLTAAVVGLGLLIFSYIRPAVSDLAAGIEHELWHAGQCLAGHGQGVHCH
jgi:hypothetical protein